MTRQPVPRALGVRGARAAIATLVVAASAGCAGAIGTRPENQSVTLSLSVPRAEAVRRTLAAFRDQGYRVKESLTSASEMTTEPFEHTDDIEATFHAAISGSEKASRVTLSGTYRERELGGLVRGREHPISRAETGVEGELWARMQNLALAIRTP
jgi:hypothetical protein